MRTLFVVLLAVIILGGGWYWYSSMQTPVTQNTEMNDPFGSAQNTQTDTNTGTNTNTSTGGTQINVDGSVSTSMVKEITVTSTGMAFNQKTLTLKKGDRVKVTFTNGGGTHDFRIDGYNVGTKVIQGGASESFEFTADKAGSFEYYCSVGNHRAMGMKGTLTVTP